jgi:hypothetical protein
MRLVHATDKTWYKVLYQQLFIYFFHLCYLFIFSTCDFYLCFSLMLFIYFFLVFFISDNLSTDKTWYKVLYQHTMYVISLSNISIKSNFKQIARVELECVQYSEGDYILCMTSHYFFHSFTNIRLRFWFKPIYVSLFWQI